MGIFNYIFSGVIKQSIIFLDSEHIIYNDCDNLVKALNLQRMVNRNIQDIYFKKLFFIFFYFIPLNRKIIDL